MTTLYYLRCIVALTLLGWAMRVMPRNHCAPIALAILSITSAMQMETAS
jgi:hypothetical protein